MPVAVPAAGTDLDPTLSPRPYLHPVRTLAGTVVSDTQPADHRWHLGVSVGIQDVSGVNFWGGRTYVRGAGYQWRDDHGTIRIEYQDATPARLTQTLRWDAPDRRTLLAETREVRTATDGQGWMLAFDFTLRNVSNRPVELGSPATNGRVNAGYGGFFWRLPVDAGPFEVATDAATGETGVHGSVADRLTLRGGAAAGTPFTLVFAGGDEATRRDPWFVRIADYPGVCSALAFTDVVPLKPGDELTRRLRVLVLDGH